MEIWDEIFALYDAWKYKKRLPKMTEQQDKDIFYQALDSQFLLRDKSTVKEVKFEDDYVVYLINEGDPDEERNYDA